MTMPQTAKQLLTRLQAIEKDVKKILKNLQSIGKNAHVLKSSADDKRSAEKIRSKLKNLK